MLNCCKWHTKTYTPPAAVAANEFHPNARHISFNDDYVDYVIPQNILANSDFIWANQIEAKIHINTYTTIFHTILLFSLHCFGFSFTSDYYYF